MSIGPSGPRPAKLVSASHPPTQVARARATSPTGTKTFMEVLSEGRPKNAAPSSLSENLATNTAKVPAGRAPSRIAVETASRTGLRSMVEGTLNAEVRVNSLIAAAARGRTFSAGELIALQATAFRYSQTVEVISRAADRLVGSIKQTLGTQV